VGVNVGAGEVTTVTVRSYATRSVMFAGVGEAAGVDGVEGNASAACAKFG
jgi:hypothetical protein